ncbi:helix-turn-helix transcriptional regulator [Kitasatospora griseola]|uniref:helix-turn-helix transcriptional regulator n=1 Tax=Kitasatospora griseola TaxID=2064 RepID=UPI00343C2607
MAAQFMDAKETAEYLNVSVSWLYREAPKAGLLAYRFGQGRNAKLQFKLSEVQAWIKHHRLSG